MNYLLEPSELEILQSNQDFKSIPSKLSAELIALIEGISCENYSHCEDYDYDRDAHVYGGSITVNYLDEDGDNDTAIITAYRGYVVPEGTDNDSGDLDFSDSVSEQYFVEI